MNASIGERAARAGNTKLWCGRVTLAMVSASLAACGDPNAPNGTGGPSSTSGNTAATTGMPSTTGAPLGCLSATTEDGSLSLNVDPANNYAFDSTVTLRPLKVAPNTPFTFDWSKLTVDLMQQPINASGGEVVTVLLSLLDLNIQDFQDKLNANEDLGNYSKGALIYFPTTSETTAELYQFMTPGNAVPEDPANIDPYLDPGEFPPEKNTYAVLVQDETQPAHGVRMVQALQLDPASVQTVVEITNDSSGLMYDTNLATVLPVQIPQATANILVDWGPLQQDPSKHITGALNALGGPWFQGSIDEVMVGHYMLTPDELTAQFLGLENIAAELYRGPVEAGAKLNLSTLVEETTAAAFPGIDDTGTWILALNCTSCTNPAPWFLTILQSCP